MTNSVIQRDMILAVARRRWDYFIIRLGSDKTAAINEIVWFGRLAPKNS